MRKGKVLGLAVLIMGLLSGCEKFEPEETAISVDNKGQVVSYVKNPLTRTIIAQRNWKPASTRLFWITIRPAARKTSRRRNSR
ncbi:MAG: hypothetical protein ACLR2E_17940 [Lachnospiraceae bacterium]